MGDDTTPSTTTKSLGARVALAMAGSLPRAAALLALAGYALAPADAGPMELASVEEHFRLRVTGIDRTEPLNRMHGFELSVLTRDGEPVAGATVNFDGQRLLTANPLPTTPRIVAASAPGVYRGEGLRFHIPGAWRVVLDIEWREIRDRATLDIVVK